MCITEHHEALLAKGAAKCGKREDHVIVDQVLQRPLHPAAVSDSQRADRHILLDICLIFSTTRDTLYDTPCCCSRARH